jgi:asparagine synthetase B (glutamine-hydrolysing)
MPAALVLAFRAAGRNAALDDAFERVAAGFPARVRGFDVDDHADERMRVRAWSHERSVGAGIERRGAAWAIVLGNPTHPDLTGAADVPARVLDRGVDGLDALSPPYAIALGGEDGAVHLGVDRCGLQHVYLHEQPDGTFWASSCLLALAEVVGGEIDADAVAEWLAVGHFISERTMVRGIRKLGAGERLRLDRDGVKSVARWRAEPAPPATDEDYRAAFLAAVRAGHGHAETAAELTGGLDSRLVLAARLRAGLPLLSWTIGDPDSAEVRTIRRLQRAVPFEHVAAQVDGDSLVDAVLEMHALADGEVNAVEYAPMLLAFPASRGRWAVSMSGSGGEIARAYYYAAIKNGRLDHRGLAHKLSSATEPVVAALGRDRFPDPHRPLMDTIEAFLASGADGTPELAAEDVYIRGRMQRFAGRNTTTTGYFFQQALPYFDNHVIVASLGLPTERKAANGAVVRDALAAWAPMLARIPLDSGIAVAPRSWRRPSTQARWGAAMGRKALVRYGGRAGRMVARSAPAPVSWERLRSEPRFHELVRDTLPARGARIHELLEPQKTTALIDAALAGGNLYSLGQLLTLELTFRRLAR